MASEKRKESPTEASDGQRLSKKVKTPDLSDPHVELVTVVVGDKDKKTFLVHRDFLTYHSPYFRKALDGPWTEAATQTVKLSHAKPEVFGLFVSWIYTDNFHEEHWVNPDPDVNSDVESDTVSDEQDFGEACRQDKPSALALIQLWVLADYLQVPKLQNLTIRRLEAKILRLTHTFPEHLSYVYKNTVDNSPLRRLFINFSVGRYDNFEVVSDWIRKRLDVVPKEFLFDVWAAGNDIRVGSVELEVDGNAYLVKEDTDDDNEASAAD